MDIFFIRHAEAQERSPTLPDDARELTEKGRRKTLKSIPLFKRRLKTGQDIHIFTSPAARALQTAQMLANELRLDQSLIRLDCIYTGDPEPLFHELTALPEDACILVVGHEPYLGSFCSMISGEPVYFRKNGMAGFSRIGTNPLRAVRVWLYRAEAAVAR